MGSHYPDEPGVPALGAQGLSHWPTKEVPFLLILREITFSASLKALSPTHMPAAPLLGSQSGGYSSLWRWSLTGQQGVEGGGGGGEQPEEEEVSLGPSPCPPQPSLPLPRPLPPPSHSPPPPSPPLPHPLPPLSHLTPPPIPVLLLPWSHRILAPLILPRPMESQAKPTLPFPSTSTLQLPIRPGDAQAHLSACPPSPQGVLPPPP